MVGITSYGAYVPMLRLPLAAIGGGGAKPGGPEKAVANWDEDAVTMAVSAAVDCLRGVDRASVDGVLFASTSYPLKEKQGAALVARALDLRRDVMTADMSDSLRAGATALRAAADAAEWLLRNRTNQADVLAGATPFLRMAGLVTSAWLLARCALVASQLRAGPTVDVETRAWLDAKIATARFFVTQLLPGAAALLPAVTGGADQLDRRAFG